MRTFLLCLFLFAGCLNIGYARTVWTAGGAGPLLDQSATSPTERPAEEGITFFHGSWEEALAKAAAEDKLIFVDAYASWCGPCKAMARNVFPKPEVGAFFNANFINLKLDMEKAESTAFRRTHQVSAYPTLFFINAKNEVVHRTVGGKPVKGLLAAGQEALTKMDDLEALAERWESEAHEPALALRYVRALVRQNEPHARVANDYLRGRKDLAAPDNLKLLLLAATEADSRIFDLLVANRAAANALVGAEAVDRQLTAAVEATLQKAVEFKSEPLLETAADKMALIDKAAGKRLALRGAFQLAAAGQDLKAFRKAAKKYLAKGVNGAPDRYQEVFRVTAASSFIDNPGVLDMATEAAAASAAADPDNALRKYYKLAEFLMGKDQPEKALMYAQKAKALVPENEINQLRAVEGLIKRLER